MNKAVYIAFLVLVSGFAVPLQAKKLTVEIGSGKNIALQSKAHLFSHFVNQKTLVDSVSANNFIVFQLDDKLPKGLYNLMVYTDLKDINGKYQRIGFDVIITGDDIEFSVDITETLSLGNVIAKSGDNFAYYRHFNESILLEQKQKALTAALNEYPQGDGFYQQLKKQFEKVKQTQTDLVNNAGTVDKFLLTNYYLQTQKTAEAKSTDNIEFNNPLLKNSPFIPILVWNYLDEAENSSTQTNVKAENVIARLKNLLPKLKTDKEVVDLMYGEISRYYEKKGLNEVVVFLNEQYLLTEACENTNLTATITQKNEALKRILIGQKAPEISFAGLEPIKKINDIKADRTLLLFWETSCPHCQQVTKELDELYHLNKNKNFEIVAIALDTSETTYKDYLSKANFEWLSYSDFKGWAGEAAKEYNIVATPSMFLLDKEKKIIAKPFSVYELKTFVL